MFDYQIIRRFIKEMTIDEELFDMIERIEAEGFLVLGPGRYLKCIACDADMNKEMRKLEKSFHDPVCKFPDEEFAVCVCDKL